MLQHIDAVDCCFIFLLIYLIIFYIIIFIKWINFYYIFVCCFSENIESVHVVQYQRYCGATNYPDTILNINNTKNLYYSTLSNWWSFLHSFGSLCSKQSNIKKVSGKFCNVSCHILSVSHSAAVTGDGCTPWRSGRGPSGGTSRKMSTASSRRRDVLRYAKYLLN